MEQADREWLAAVHAGHPPGAFGHREHLRLAWLSLEAADAVEAADRDVCACIRAIAARHGAPQKYNQTVTAAWVRIVDHVRSASAVRTFDELLELAPWLFDKRLLLRHYTSQTLASEAARSSYVAPDLYPIPGQKAAASAWPTCADEWPPLHASPCRSDLSPLVRDDRSVRRSLISGYQGGSTDDTLDKIIRLQALISVWDLIGRTSVGIVWRVIIAPIWLVVGLVAIVEGSDLFGGIALLLALWALPMALANLRLARRTY